MWKLLLNFIPGVGPFLSAAGSFIANHWQFFAVAGMVGMLAYQNFSATRFLFGIPTIPHFTQQLAADQVTIGQLKSDLKIATDANAKLTKSIQDQNLTIQQWAVISEHLKQDNAKLQTTLDNMRTTNENNVKHILNGKTPTSCEASIQYLRDMSQKLVW